MSKRPRKRSSSSNLITKQKKREFWARQREKQFGNGKPATTRKKAVSAERITQTEDLYKVVENAHPSIIGHTNSLFCRTITFREYEGEKKRYQYELMDGRKVETTGLKFALFCTYYPKLVRNRSKRRSNTNIKGSSAVQGQRVDRELMAMVNGEEVLNPNKITSALCDYWAENGHVVQCAQLPVEIKKLDKVTQSDIITMAPDGKLWLWECKSGAPVGGSQSHGLFFEGGIVDEHGKPVPCTEINTWYIQLEFTRAALVDAGVEIREARVIQVHEWRQNDQLNVKVHDTPTWATLIDTRDRRGQYRPVVIKKRAKTEEDE